MEIRKNNNREICSFILVKDNVCCTYGNVLSTYSAVMEPCRHSRVIFYVRHVHIALYQPLQHTRNTRFFFISRVWFGPYGRQRPIPILLFISFVFRPSCLCFVCVCFFHRHPHRRRWSLGTKTKHAPQTPHA